jgi:rare lipoprotein A
MRINWNIKLPLLFCLVIAVLLLNRCSGRGDNWEVVTEAEPPKEERQEEEKPSTPDSPGRQEREEITVKPVTEKPEEIELEQVKEAAPVSGDIFQAGIASWYGEGDDFQGKRTANGEIYDMHKLTAAHKTLPFHTLVEVENVDNGKKVTVRINDRGPFIKGRIIDLSKTAAKRIGILAEGTAPVRLRVVKTPEGGTHIQPAQPPASKPPTETAEPKDSPPVTVTGQPESRQTYYLQVGAFSSMKNAKRLLRNIERILPKVSFKIEYKDGLYKIMSDWLASREEAEKFKDRLDKSGIDSFIREE